MDILKSLVSFAPVGFNNVLIPESQPQALPPPSGTGSRNSSLIHSELGAALPAACLGVTELQGTISPGSAQLAWMATPA